MHRNILTIFYHVAFFKHLAIHGTTPALLYNTRIARGEHQNIKLVPGDTVIFSSRKIPGNESRINWVMNQLARKKIDIITEYRQDIHVSGHPARGELARMYELVRPQIAVPTHGEAQHLREHAKLAKSLGIKETVEAYNGAVIWLEAGEASVIGTVHSGYTAIDGTSFIPTDGDVMRTRRKLRDEGSVFVSLSINDKGRLEGNVRLDAPGLLDAKEDGEIMKEWAAEAADVVENAKAEMSEEALAEEIRVRLRQLIRRELEKKPVITVHVVKAA